MNREVKVTSIIIIVGLCALLGVLTFNSLREISSSPEEQVSIQEEELEVIGRYDIGAFLWVYKIHDNRDSVTCWIYSGTQEGGISCIPDHLLTP